MKYIKKIFIVSLASFLLASCVETQAIEKIGIINARGLDTKDDLIETTVVAFQFTPEAKEMTKVITGKGKTVKGALESAESSALYKLAPGKIKLSVFGKELAEKGILPFLDTAARDARVPDLMYLSVSKTTAKELLSISEENIATNIGQFLHGLIENHSTGHNIPRKTLQDFLRIYYDVGHDNVLPLFEIEEDAPKLVSFALFKGDQMVGELTNDEITLINIMDRTVEEHPLEFSFPLEPFKDHLEERERMPQETEVQIMFLIDKGNSKTKIVDIDRLAFQTDTTLKLRLLEQSSGIVLKKSQVITLLEKEVKKEMENRFEKLLVKVQKLDTDPFGYGRLYKKTQKGKELTIEEWREIYPTIEVDFNVDVEIIQHGVID
ncbi:Ger(x)C family spore germination protein [Sporosarcina sp. Marseille-Q4063]|uniref:Ger(x)C family spore germination protein n=1 Tax=Sporosarcina sp. Marseille-Q4063 TaxID=2810514 RepID=UPI001BB09771|nr:Ger(x)C family spore germination protein [Sporosarcina sp. Marseille-Q4063]QUW23140.1 Ger(x)C family spore germination protein [Sporosarcina sp. Marseille-Q4063]